MAVVSKTPIEEKKEKKQPVSTIQEKLQDFYKSIGITLATLIWTFVVGSRVVYACKVAQSGILPTNISCMPYDKTPIQYESTEPICDIDVKYIYDKESKSYTPYSTKIFFPIDDQVTDGYYLIKLIRETENDPHVSPMMKYLCVVLKNIFVFHFGLVSGILNFMNQTFNESTIIILGPYLLKFYLAFAYIMNMIVCFIICIINAGWLFKSNKNNDEYFIHKKLDEPVWRKCKIFENWKNLFGTLIYLVIAFWIVIFMCFSPIATIIAFIAVFIPLFNKGAKIIPPDKQERDSIPQSDWTPYGYMQSLKGLLATKIHFFMFLFGMSTTINAYKYIGSGAGAFILIATVIFLYHTMNKSETVPSLATSPLSGFDRNEKTHQIRIVSAAEKLREETELAEEAIRDKKEQEERAKGGFVGLLKSWGVTWFDILAGPDEKCPADVNELIPESNSSSNTNPNSNPNASSPTHTKPTVTPHKGKAHASAGPHHKGGSRDNIQKRIKELTNTIKHRSSKKTI